MEKNFAEFTRRGVHNDKRVDGILMRVFGRTSSAIVLNPLIDANVSFYRVLSIIGLPH